MIKEVYIRVIHDRINIYNINFNYHNNIQFMSGFFLFRNPLPLLTISIITFKYQIEFNILSLCQGTIYRNAQLRYTQIVYCTLWEECKQTQCPHRSWRERTTALMWYYSPTKNKLIYLVRANTYEFWLSGQYWKYNSNIFLFHPLGPFPSKMMCCPWILGFDLLPLQYTDLTH